MEKPSLKEIIAKTDSEILKKWILDYADKNPQFALLIEEKFNPVNLKGSDVKNYPLLIRAAFLNNPYQSGNHYYDWADDGFDAYEVRDDLEEILSDADYFLEHGNRQIAVQICKEMIEIIPEEWEEQFDHEGDVQVMYDEAIDKLEMMLKEQLLSENEKEDLFKWYEKESKNTEKHKYVGLNTSFDEMQFYFLSSEEMISQNLKLLDKKIQSSPDNYYTERYVIDKIEILRDIGRAEEMQETIDKHLRIRGVRKIKLGLLLENGEYVEAIKLIEDGILVAEEENHQGTIADWKDELLNIYQIQNDRDKILKLAEDLFYNGREHDKYYKILKQYIPEKNWQATVNKMIQKLTIGRGLWGFNRFRAKILIEHERWEELLKQCQIGGVQYVEEFEKYFRPRFDVQLYKTYLNYIEEQATITNQEAYENVGRMLQRLKSFTGGKEKVQELIAQYRITYKRRKNMMKVLDKVEGRN